jgi:hypothetical protein
MKKRIVVESQDQNPQLIRLFEWGRQAVLDIGPRAAYSLGCSY